MLCEMLRLHETLFNTAVSDQFVFISFHHELRSILFGFIAICNQSGACFTEIMTLCLLLVHGQWRTTTKRKRKNGARKNFTSEISERNTDEGKSVEQMSINYTAL